MIKFEKVRWKNFLSTGDQWTNIQLDKTGTTLVVGANGAGKSTMLDALCFVLFNKPYRRITKLQMVNSSNEKGTLVEVEFKIGTKSYLVRRGIKPNIFDIEINGEMRNKEADDRINQKILEDHILKLNYKSFTQIVILGSSTFVPFMQLSGSNRREVIEDLLDIRIFSAMNNLIKDKIRVKKEQIRSLDLKKDNLKDKMTMQRNFINELEKKGKSDISTSKGKIGTLIEESDGYVDTNVKLETQVADLIKKQEEFSGADKKLSKLNNLKGKISQKVSTITKEHKFFTDNVTCPTCTQPIEEEFRLNRISDVQTKARELKKGYQDLESSIKTEQDRERHFTSISKQITKINHDISQNNTRISLNQRQIRDLESEIQTITQQFKNRSSENEKLKEFKDHFINKIIPIMPIKADLLMSKYKISKGKILGDKIKSIEEKWVENNFNISDQEVENILKN